MKSLNRAAESIFNIPSMWHKYKCCQTGLTLYTTAIESKLQDLQQKSAKLQIFMILQNARDKYWYINNTGIRNQDLPIVGPKLYTLS